MTIGEAIKAKLYPYSLPEASIELLAESQGLDMSDDYDHEEHEYMLAQIEVDALWQLVTLKKESDGGSSQEYDLDLIMSRIKRVSTKYNIDYAQPSSYNEDITDCW